MIYSKHDTASFNFIFTGTEQCQKVLIVGDSIVYWAARYMISHFDDPVGWGLPNVRITIRAVRGRPLCQLVRSVKDYTDHHGTPTMLIICLGANDIKPRKPVHLTKHLISDAIGHIRQTYPSLVVVWSDILHRQHYGTDYPLETGQNCRKALNVSGRQAAQGSIRHHVNIRPCSPVFHDSIHLNDLGCKLFLGNILQFLKDHFSTYVVGEASHSQ